MEFIFLLLMTIGHANRSFNSEVHKIQHRNNRNLGIYVGNWVLIVCSLGVHSIPVMKIANEIECKVQITNKGLYVTMAGARK